MTRPLIPLLAVLLAGPADAARKLPYWASLGAGEVMMRTGPGRNFPGQWLYRRVGLPVKVVKTYTVAHSEWRKVQDPDGAEGWIQANLLSDRRTGLIVGEIRPLRVKPAGNAPTVWRAEPGVIGRLSQCGRGWCALDVRGQSGFVEVAHLFGVTTDEALP